MPPVSTGPPPCRLALLPPPHRPPLTCSRPHRRPSHHQPVNHDGSRLAWRGIAAAAADPFAFCELCGTGDGIVPCPACSGQGRVLTKPGGAGARFLVGSARCKVCNGQGRIPCMLCAGAEARLPPPQPFRPAGEPFCDDDEETGQGSSGSSGDSAGWAG